MAVTRSESVIVVTANNDTIAGPVDIESILYTPGTGSPNASIAINGTTVWTAASASTRLFENAEIWVSGGATITVSMAGTGTALYLYTE